MRVYVKITKLSSNTSESERNHNTGYSVIGYFLEESKLGKSFKVLHDYPIHKVLATSKVTEIIDEFTFKTLNSTYQIEYLDQK